MSTTKLISQAPTDNLDMDTKTNIGKAIGRIPSGVFVVTIMKEGVGEGLLASWVSQVAFEPPMISVAVHQQRHILKLLDIGSQFVLNVLSSKSGSILKNFAKPYQEGCNRFAGLSLLPNRNGSLIFAQSLAYLECVSRSMVQAGDHVVVLAEVTNGGLISAGNVEPMVHLRSSGFVY